MRWPIGTFIAMMLVMVWLAGELWFFRPTSMTLLSFMGATTLLLGNIIWLISYYYRSVRNEHAVVVTCYFIGHFLIVHSLYL